MNNSNEADWSLDLEIKSEIKDFISQVKSSGEKCTECGLTLKNKNNLQSHMKMVHVASRPFPCTECTSTFKSKIHLASHAAVHSDDKPFSCHLCDKTFKLVQSKTSHMKTHDETRQKQNNALIIKRDLLKIRI